MHLRVAIVHLADERGHVVGPIEVLGDRGWSWGERLSARVVVELVGV